MKNILDHNGSEQLLLSNVDDGTNTLYINGVEIPSSSWVGTGNYSQVIAGTTITIAKVASVSGNLMLKYVSGTHYIFENASEGHEDNVLLWTAGSSLLWS